MQYAFQDYDNLYLVMDLLTGGDLRYHISRHRKFSEEQTSNKFINFPYLPYLPYFTYFNLLSLTSILIYLK
jgi:hypothetical protein